LKRKKKKEKRKKKKENITKWRSNQPFTKIYTAIARI
jgi:hypothetical protein